MAVDNHVDYVCAGGHDSHCMFCDGGLWACSVCDSFEGATTSNCPGRRMTEIEIEGVYAGRVDFRDGEWIRASSPHTPNRPEVAR